MEGFLTEIERFSLSDGPGIRTTVFFKGCNMRCKWCHNPETISFGKELLYHPAKCIGCYKCVYACLTKAQRRINNMHVYYPNICAKCGRCASLCYAGAMELCGKKYSVEDVMKEIRQDKPYYLNSNGGVTLSGGEVLCQKEFALELISACHKEGISVGIETNLNFPWETVADVLKEADLIMCDIKLFDDAEHKKWTGAGNENVLTNVKRLAESEKPFLVRTPLIPGATDSDENIAAIAKYLAEVAKKDNFMYYELLNFNPLGESKYDSLSRQNEFKGVKPLKKERVAALKALAEGFGIKTKTE